MEQRFDIGKRYKPIGKDYWCEVVDVHKTYNSKGELISIHYVATHEFCGQIVTDYRVVDPTIARGQHE
jgi:hypothetical protein